MKTNKKIRTEVTAVVYNTLGSSCGVTFEKGSSFDDIISFHKNESDRLKNSTRYKHGKNPALHPFINLYSNVTNRLIKRINVN